MGASARGCTFNGRRQRRGHAPRIKKRLVGVNFVAPKKNPSLAPQVASDLPACGTTGMGITERGAAR